MEKNKSNSCQMVVGIDASNLSSGGGLTHLIEIISELNPKKHNFKQIIIWGSKQTLELINNKPWILKKSPKALNSGLISRLLWQRLKLSKLASSNQCDILFIPGGSFACSFRPVVTMSRNMLPFEWSDLRRYGLSMITCRLIILRWLQSRSFRSADGVIFLTDYAQVQVTRVTGKLKGMNAIIHHGLNQRFFIKPNEQSEISKFSLDNPFQILYVSIIDQYKHQWHVADAVSKLRKNGYPVELILIGPAYPFSLKKLIKKINKIDKKMEFIKYYGSIPYEDLHKFYEKSHLGVFASSCENMPNILLEKMAAGLPIASSNKGPMPEVLAKDGLYFDPLNSEEILGVLKKYIDNSDLRAEKAQASFYNSQKYTWSVCAKQTFSFLEDVIEKHNKSVCVE